ncbi:GGDEF domain-containing protein [Treponema primitia]|uniref:GGDEF domain-containing protein n=1 Tax=Treponema primitia TaxID=88058 RepID=UPI000255568F|nr:GGDEF domain-containing protein [Treponema primitia]
MHISVALNSIIGSALVIILIFADYFRKYNTDGFQRNAFFHVLLTAIVAMLADFGFYLLNGVSGTVVRYVLYVDLLIFFIFQIAAFYYVFILIDYLTFKEKERTKRIAKIVWAMFILNGIFLLINIPLDFYFYLTPDNVFHYGNKYFIRLIISYFPVLMVLVDIFFLAKNVKTSQAFLCFFFILFTGLGSSIDILFKTVGLIWPCFTSALLYAYFFIIQSDSKIDSLTGIGNRYSFNEFINQVSGQNAKQPYSVVMIDMDHFKEINDTLGHLEGDNALRDMAAIIKGCIRNSDFAARYGGDEFVLAAKKESDVIRLMERIQQAINNQNEKKVRPYTIQISYGYDVFIPNSGQSIEAFLSHIDNLMYKHKAAKRRSTD